MTKKHFIALAREIAEIRDDTARRAAANAVAEACRTQSYKFDRERFLTACRANVKGDSDQ